MKVLILGGGLAGSTVAYLLGKKGYGDLSIVEILQEAARGNV